jgi:hypothetical protein
MEVELMYPDSVCLIKLLVLTILSSQTQSIGNPPEIITIGGVLSSREAQNVFDISVNKLNFLNGPLNLHFNSTSIIMDPNPIQSSTSSLIKHIESGYIVKLYLTMTI